MNNTKKFSAIVLILVLAVTIMCGCGGQQGSVDTNPTTEAPKTDSAYSVTIVDQNGNPVSNVILQFADADGSTELVVTDANGAASVTAKTAMISVTLSSLPKGYTSAETVVKFEGKTELKITVQAEESANTNVTYTVTVIDQNGNPVPGVTLQLCDDENCKLPVVTDENGIATCTFEAADYHVTLTALPDGYSSDVMEFQMDGNTEITIEITAG